MIAAASPNRQSAKLLAVDRHGRMRHLARTALGLLFRPGDLVIANDAATLPASLAGVHCASNCSIEVRLAAWVATRDPTRFTAIALGAGDHRTPTEDRPPPPRLSPGDRLTLGPLTGLVENAFDPPRLFGLRLLGSRAVVLAGIARHGRPIQYAHVPQPVALWDVWTSIADRPIAFEPPSAGFALDWRTQATWRNRGVEFVTITHAAGISTTGDPALDQRLPFDEPYHIPERTTLAVKRVKSGGGRVIAIGTSVMRALESAADADGTPRPGEGVAQGRIEFGSAICVADAILTGVHQPGESHYELLRAFADEKLLVAIATACEAHGYRAHEFGDSVLLERPTRMSKRRRLGTTVVAA
jgi:S-adenosylmethionine:tRNA ribosyltransferase-isomerase